MRGSLDDLVEERRTVLAQELRDVVAPVRWALTDEADAGCAARVHSGALRRGSNVTGVVRIGPALLPLNAFAGTVNRVQTARPDRHRSSSHVKS